MILYISLTVVVVLLGLLVKRKEYVTFWPDTSSPGKDIRSFVNGWFAWMCFILLGGVSACRVAVGNDYWVYRFQFNLIMQHRHVSYEPGFNAVVYVLQSLFGYDNYKVVFGFFSIVTCALFVWALYSQGEWFGGSIFMLLCGGYYFLSLNSVRYYFVLAVAMVGMKFVIEKKYTAFLVSVLLAATIHKSVLIVIPGFIAAAFLSRIKWKKWIKVLLPLYGALCVLMVVGKPLWRKIIFTIYPFYENSMFDNGGVSYANIIKCLAGVALTVVCMKMLLSEDSCESGNGVMHLKFYSVLNL
ncbi:MAG: EpsG family protein, partial [Lachnospiraceae bacterium]|nr:EpsG family protein [Lachnospiraceae bacterium]